MCIYIGWTCILVKCGDNEQCSKTKSSKGKIQNRSRLENNKVYKNEKPNVHYIWMFLIKKLLCNNILESYW